MLGAPGGLLPIHHDLALQNAEDASLDCFATSLAELVADEWICLPVPENFSQGRHHPDHGSVVEGNVN